LARLRADAVEWWAVGDQLYVRPLSVPDELAAAIRAHKAALCWLSVHRLTPCWFRPLSEAWLTDSGWFDFTQKGFFDGSL
jgi:hypothetical protein